MAVTQNTYTGDGTTVLFSFTFPYLETTDIKVSLNGTNTTAYTLANATTIQFNTAPANGAAIRIYRQTDDSALAATFYPGSAIRSADLNENFTQNLYVTQESNNISATATTTANTALTNSNTAISTANSAVSTANTASTNASAAVATANTASTNASAAVSTANTASSNATAAVNTANTASTNASNAVTTANTALSTANTASSNASAAVATANTASSNASAAVSTANTASSNATTAVNTANNALSTANAATTTANTASTNATAALNAVAGSLQYTLVANVAGIPGSPVNNQAIEIADSTGIESFSPLTNRPAGFVGDSGLSVRLQYLSAGSSWNWLNYFANNSETRYLKFGGGTITGNLEIGNSGSLTFEGSTANTFETTLAVTDPTADRTITLPDVSGTVVTTGDTGSVTSTMIADGTIVNADVNASAAIAGSKISPDFGAQNVTTTGTSTAASFIPTSSTVPTNGLYLPSAGSVAISTNGTGRLFINSLGDAGIGQSSPSSIAPGYSTLSVGTTSGGGIRFYEGATLRAQFVGNANGGTLESVGSTYLGFNTNGAERLRITSAGLVGVGTSSVSSNLHIKPANGDDSAFTNGLRVERHDTSGQYALFSYTGGAASITAVETTASNPVVRFLRSTNGSTTTESLRIDASGRVGVGTTSPSGLLSVHEPTASTANYINITNAATGASSWSNGLIIGVSTSGAGLCWQNENLDFLFGTNNTERLRITSDGKVGIGNSAPSKLLTIGTSSTANTTVRLNCSQTAGSDTAMYSFGIDDSTDFAGMRLDFTDRTTKGLQIFTASGFGYPISFSGSSGNQDVTIDTSGRVGIGTTSPASSLHISGTGSTYTRYVNTSNASQSFDVGSNSGGTSFVFENGNYPLLFGTNGTERARIDSSGRLLVGTSTSSGYSSARMIVTGAGTDATGSGNLVLQIGQANGSVTSGEQIGTITFGDTSGYSYATIEAAADLTAGSDSPGRLVFSTTADGASSPTEAMRIANRGGVFVGSEQSVGIVSGLTASAGVINACFVAKRNVTRGNVDGSGVDVFFVWSNGDVHNANNAYGPIASDERLKQDITDANSQWDDIKNIRITNFHYKSDPAGPLQLGPIAQELEKVSPGLITRRPASEEEVADPSNGLVDGDEVLSFKASILYMKAVKALQEAMKRIETLEAKVAALESA